MQTWENKEIALGIDLEKSGFIKIKLKCKGRVTTYSIIDDVSENETIIFETGKWYDAWVKPYNDKHSQKINGGGYQDHVLRDEQGTLRKESKAWMKASFYYTEEDQKRELRDSKLDDLTK